MRSDSFPVPPVQGEPRPCPSARSGAGGGGGSPGTSPALGSAWDKPSRCALTSAHGWFRALTETFPARLFPGFWPSSGLPSTHPARYGRAAAARTLNPRGPAALGRVPALPAPPRVRVSPAAGTARLGMDPAELSGWAWFVLLFGWMCSRAQLRAQLPACGC